MNGSTKGEYLRFIRGFSLHDKPYDIRDGLN